MCSSPLLPKFHVLRIKIFSIFSSSLSFLSALIYCKNCANFFFDTKKAPKIKAFLLKKFFYPIVSNITLSMYLQTFDTHSSNNQKCPDIVLQMHTHMNYLPRHFYSFFSFYSLVKWSLEILWGEYVQDFLLIIFCKKCAERTFDSLIDSLMIFKHKKSS